MAGKPVDYDGMISVYNKINKTRALTAEEAERLAHIIDRKLKIVSERRYRDKNKDKIAKRTKRYLKTKKGKAKTKRANDNSYARHREDKLRRSKEWREKNPDKVKNISIKKQWLRRLKSQPARCLMYLMLVGIAIEAALERSMYVEAA
jgi:non-homologous end joining protein Ku